jgi:formylglycine-generating enzyme
VSNYQASGHVIPPLRSDDKQSGGCCTPRADFLAAEPARRLQQAPAASTEARGESMVKLAGGTFLMGTDYPGGFPNDGECPVREVYVSPFAIDRFPVTNAEFAQFVEATGYRTEAEQFGWSFVFWLQVPAARVEELVEDSVAAAPWWNKVRGAFWREPEGLGSSIDDRADHPVVHVSWNDAAAYAVWAGKSLPTEAEWEFAARGGRVQKLYPWGDELTPEGRHYCNIWQGEFPYRNTAEDGFVGTCPVDAFPPNGYGLSSMTGNVWEWCSDWFSNSFCADGVAQNPGGPAGGTARVMKGGSFLCHASYCNRYRVAARTANTPDSSASNIGFRCIRRKSEN